MTGPPPVTLTPATRSPHALPARQLVRDVRRHYGVRAAGGSCRIRIYTAAEQTPVILCSQLAATRNWCISAVVEYLAASTLARYLPHRFDEPEPAIWLEHYPTDPVRQQRGAGRLDIALVHFASWRPVVGQLAGQRHPHLGEPSWQPLTEAEMTALLGPLPGLFDDCASERQKASSRP
ncbi:MAG: hypothetical protein KC442_10770 [Thermomicrobiales bacterium]|nr:hypothetical protein [Thermomicrobiales bacterium]